MIYGNQVSPPASPAIPVPNAPSTPDFEEIFGKRRIGADQQSKAAVDAIGHLGESFDCQHCGKSR